ncbi:MAG: tetratricopeptide repeat protein [Treponema sp.]|jgi:tetratricopeptide (TPR) repeat protein|nr:tetratricopeptide repeat protein [Treponema sp.]
MPQKTVRYLLFFTVLALPLAAQSRAEPEELVKTGISLFGEGKFAEAATVLNLAVQDTAAANRALGAEALYWKALAELSGGEYEKSLADLDLLAKGSYRTEEIPYQRGRCYYYMGRYEEGFAILARYAEAEKDGPRKAAAHYWAGECLLSLGQLDKAADAFSLVVERYPASVKFEAAKYRLDLINQKKVEAELLAILKWSHEESLRTLEEYRRREKTYDEAIRAYQARLGEMIEGGEGLSAEERGRVTALETDLLEANAALELMRQNPAALGDTGFSAPKTDADRTILLLELKAAALELSNTLNKRLNGEKQ